MIALILKATLLLALVGVIDVGLLRRRGSAAARHLVWTLAVVALLALPGASFVLPAWRVIDVRAARAASAELPPDEVRSFSVRPSQTGPASTLASHAARSVPTDDRPPVDIAGIALALYALVALALLLRLVGQHAIVSRLTRACSPMRDDDWSRMLASVRESLGVRREVALLEGPNSVMPLTWGMRRPSVLLPSSAASWPYERRRAVLLHEVAHVARRDCLTQTLAAVACALYWPHPLVWLAAHRLRVEREHACDELAVSAGIPRLNYAEHLLEIARSYRAPRLSTGAVAMARSRVEGRLRALIDGRRAVAAPSRRAKLAAVLASSALLLPLAAMAPAATQAETTQPHADITGRWELRLATVNEHRGAGPLVHLALRAPGMNTQYLPFDAFDGLPRDVFERDADVRFTLTRGPGRFRFVGAIANARGTGTFTFTPDARFADALVARGMQRPTDAQLFTLARHGMELDFLDELAAQGYPQPTTETYVRTALTGIDVGVLRDLRARETRFETLEELVSMWNDGELAQVAPPPPPMPDDLEPVPAAPPAPPAPEPTPAIGAAPAPAVSAEATPAFGAAPAPAVSADAMPPFGAAPAPAVSARPMTPAFRAASAPAVAPRAMMPDAAADLAAPPAPPAPIAPDVPADVVAPDATPLAPDSAAPTPADPE